MQEMTSIQFVRKHGSFQLTMLNDDGRLHVIIEYPSKKAKFRIEMLQNIKYNLIDNPTIEIMLAALSEKILTNPSDV